MYDTAFLRLADHRGRALTAAVDQSPVRELPLDSLGRGPFRRVTGTDEAHVRLLAEVANFDELPPILVQRGSLRVIDGAHRLEAAKARGEKLIRARVVDCTDDDAYVLAVCANTLDGLPLCRADRVASARRILGWHPDWSDRAIGTVTGLSAGTVGGIRQESASEAGQFTKRLGRDGRRRPVTALKGRERAAEYIAAWPDAPLREVARQTDVSLGTAADVRARMRRGLDPVIPGGDGRGGGGGRRQGRHPAAAPRWPQLAPKLADDPSLRYTEGGRAFLRWMTTLMTGTAQWREFADAVPAHWLDDVGRVAEQASEEWRCFAEHLRRRQGSAGLGRP